MARHVIWNMVRCPKYTVGWWQKKRCSDPSSWIQLLLQICTVHNPALSVMFHLQRSFHFASLSLLLVLNTFIKVHQSRRRSKCLSRTVSSRLVALFEAKLELLTAVLPLSLSFLFGTVSFYCLTDGGYYCFQNPLFFWRPTMPCMWQRSAPWVRKGWKNSASPRRLEVDTLLRDRGPALTVLRRAAGCKCSHQADTTSFDHRLTRDRIAVLWRPQPLRRLAAVQASLVDVDVTLINGADAVAAAVAVVACLADLDATRQGKLCCHGRR